MARDRQAPAGSNDADIRAWLLNHRDFFVRNPDLLTALALPGGGGGVADFQAYALAQLRHRLLETGNPDGILAALRATSTAQVRLHEAALAALDAEGLDHLLHIVGQEWPVMLGLDAVAIAVEGDFAGAVAWLLPGRSRALAGDSGARLLRDGAAEHEVFGPAAALVRVRALVALNGPVTGLLGLGSRDAQAFAAGQGTEGPRFLGALLERCLARWLRP